MNRILKIATAHSVNMKKEKGKKIEVTMQGGSPFFTYIWLNDSLYSLTGDRTFKLRRIK